MSRITLSVPNTFAIPLLLWVFASAAPAEDRALHRFARQELSNVYFSEGANAGDLNGDGKPDVVCGPYWYAGPDFLQKHEIYPPVPQPREKYADNFFSWIHDFNADGAGDIFVVGFPGTPAYVYENPRNHAAGRHWKKHQVFDWVSNESPHFTDIDGDSKPDLVCTRDGFYGYATVDWSDGLKPWTFHPISDKSAAPKFGHGLGVGDVNGDGRMDLLIAGGWFEQPAAQPGSSVWKFHPAAFCQGGAEMYAYDVDGDGDNDIITSLAAHDFGLAWFENIREGGQIKFRKHLIMGSTREENRYGVLFSELHSVALADIDGDGLKDIVTGKTYWSHHKKSPLWDAGAVVYWFQLARGKEGVDWIPHQADGESGIGRQISVVQINGDTLPDLVVGGMKGTYVLRHERQPVSETEWQQAQPKAFDGYRPAPPQVVGAAAKAAQPARLAGSIEGEDLKAIPSAGQLKTQAMKSFAAGRWSGDSQLFWTPAQIGDHLDCPLSVAQSGKYQLQIVLTKAPDYAIVQLQWDGKDLAQPIDLYDKQVVTTGALSLGEHELSSGPHTLSIRIAGANPAAKKGLRVGLDCLLLLPVAAK